MSDEPQTERTAETAHEALTVAMARAMLQVTHIIGATEAHDGLKAALSEFSPSAVPEAYREPEPVEDAVNGEQPE